MCLLLLAMKRPSSFKNHYCYEYCDVTNLIFIHEIYNIHVYICNVLGEFMYNCENNKSWILIKKNIPMTGDPKADADIMAFIKARQNILRKAQLDQR